MKNEIQPSAQSLDETIHNLRLEELKALNVVNKGDESGFVSLTKEDVNFLNAYIKGLSGKTIDTLKDYEKNKEILRQNEQVISAINHDLSNTLTGYNTVARFCISEYKKLNERNSIDLSPVLTGYMKMLDDFSTTMRQRFEKYMQWAKNTLKGSYSKSKFYDIQELLESNNSELELKAKLKNVTLITESYKEQNGQINNANDDAFVDKHIFDIIKTNLVTNSIKFTPSGKNIYFSVEPFEENYWKFAVQDEGEGISSDKKNQLFKIKGLTTMGTNGETGTGKGLMICREFVEQQGGKIWIDEETKTGAKIYFTIPKYTPAVMIKSTLGK